MLPVVSHIAYRWLNREAIENFYTKYFGFKRAQVFNPNKSNELVVLKLGAMRLELFQLKGDLVPATVSNSTGYLHLAFEVDNLEVFINQLNADNIQTGEIHDCSFAVEGMCVCFFKDPEGNIIEIMQGYKDDKILYPD